MSSTEVLQTLLSDNIDIHKNVAEKYTLHPFLLFWEPLKKSVKCGMSEMNNFFEMNKPLEDTFPRLD